mgnify:FL=1
MALPGAAPTRRRIVPGLQGSIRSAVPLSIGSIQFSPLVLPYVAAVAVMVALAVGVAIREWSAPVGRVYLLYAIGPIAWMAWSGSTYVVTDPHLAESLCGITLALITLSTPALYQFAILAGERPSRARSKVRLAWAVAILFAVAQFNMPLLVDGIHRFGWGVTGRGSRWLLLLIGYHLLLVALCLGNFWRAWRNPTALCAYRSRNRLLFFGLCLSLVSVIDVLPGFGVPIPPVGGFFIVAFFGVISYVAWRYRLAEITPEVAAAQVLTTMSDALLVVDSDEVVRLANPAAQRLFGDDDPVGRPLARVLLDSGVLSEVRRRLNGQSPSPAQLDYVDRNGQRRVLCLSVAPLRPHQRGGHICVFNDITALRQAENERERLSRSLETTLNELAAANWRLQRKQERDAVTGLYNRRHLEEALDRMWLGAQRRREWLALLMVDIDQFRAFNETYGAVRGDELLRRMGAVLQEAAHFPGNLTARIGSDEFVLVLPGTDVAGAVRVAERVQRLVELSVGQEDDTGRWTVCIGIAAAMPAGDDAGTPQTLLRAADTALLEAKRHGTSRICVANAPSPA